MRLSQIDRLILESQDHYYLDEDDQCFFLGEYTARRGFKFSDTNQLIYNLKKSPEFRETSHWCYKERAIEKAAEMLRATIAGQANQGWLRAATLVPVPPSKVEGDPLYDDRMLRVLQELGVGLNLDIRQLVLQKDSALAAHESQNRPRPHEIAENYIIDERVTSPNPITIGVFDDLLTTRSHFKAMKSVLLERFPGARITGVFLARRVPETDDPIES